LHTDYDPRFFLIPGPALAHAARDKKRHCCFCSDTTLHHPGWHYTDRHTAGLGM